MDNAGRGRCGDGGGAGGWGRGGRGAGRTVGQEVTEDEELAAIERGCGSSGRRRGGTCRRRRRDTPPRDTPPPAARTLESHHEPLSVRIMQTYQYYVHYDILFLTAH